jgi:hypothetical protein
MGPGPRISSTLVVFVGAAMGASHTGRQPLIHLRVALLSVLGLALLSGCQGTQPLVARRLIQHQSMIDFSGLKPVESVKEIRCSLSAPAHWTVLPLQRRALYNHQQWKSPSTATGIGIAYIRLPIPLSAKTIVWFAKEEYAKKGPDGKILSEWTDKYNRWWFEAENTRYHVRGYVIVDGRDAWIAYSGYKRSYPLEPGELSLAARCMETILPRGVALAANEP